MLDVTTLVPDPVGLPPDCVALRDEVRAFLADQRAAGRWQPQVDGWFAGWDERFSRALGERGWLGMTLPRAYGGRAASLLQRYTVIEELVAAGAPVAAHWVADQQVAPGLLRHGTEAQRREFLPGILAGRTYFGVAVSEPHAGSDAASITTSARPVAGGWRLTGTKTWVSGASRVHALVVLARTDVPSDPGPGGPAGTARTGDRRGGMSQFLVGTDVPGVSVRPQPVLTGRELLGEVTLDDVFVPDDRVLGELGAGWTQLMGQLAFERSGPEQFLSTFPLLGRLAETPWTPSPADPAAAPAAGSERDRPGSPVGCERDRPGAPVGCERDRPGAPAGSERDRPGSPVGCERDRPGEPAESARAVRAGDRVAERRALGRTLARAWALRQMSLGVAGALGDGQAPELAASLVKELGSRFGAEVVDTAREVRPEAPDPAGGPDYPGLLAQAIRSAPSFTLRGGSNEVLRGIVARGMGLAMSTDTAPDQLQGQPGRPEPAVLTRPIFPAGARRDPSPVGARHDPDPPPTGARSGSGLLDAVHALWTGAADPDPLPLTEPGLLAGWLAHLAGLPGGGNGDGGFDTVAVAPGLVRDGGTVVADGVVENVAWGRSARRILVLSGEHVVALDPASVDIRPGTNLAGEPRDAVTVRLRRPAPDRIATVPPGTDRELRLRAAFGRAALLAGAAAAALRHVVDHAGRREQFGRPIARFQAVAQQLAEAGAEVAAARAAVLGAARLLDESGFAARSALVAVASARIRAGDTATVVARIAHQVHGAAGLDPAAELGRLSARLWAWRDEDGCESHWADVLGELALRAGPDHLWPLVADAPTPHQPAATPRLG